MQLRFDPEWRTRVENATITDITDTPYQISTDPDGTVVLEFAEDITPQERELLAIRITRTDNENAIRARVSDALVSLRNIAQGTGTMTAADATQAIRLIARVLIGLIRLIMRRFESAD